MRPLVLTASLLLACGATTVPVEVPPPADMTAPPPPASVCTMPVGTIDKNTPDKGYWVSSGCAVDCLPPHQFFSICTTNSGMLLFDSTTELQQYGATWETYLRPNPCASTPWRVWQLQLVPLAAAARAHARQPGALGQPLDRERLLALPQDQYGATAYGSLITIRP